MADFLFDRRVKLLIATPLATDYLHFSAQTVVIEDLRVQFKIEKSLDKGPNKAEIRVTNLAAKTRAALQVKGAKLVLQAGYQSNLAQIFVGDVRTIDHDREGPDWSTKIEAGDGERAYLNARISESFAANVKIPTIVKLAASKLGLDVSDVDKSMAAAQGRSFDNGYVAHGPASAELDRVLAAAGYEWSVQDSKIQILRPGTATTERVVTLSSDSGLIGSPTYVTPEKKGSAPLIKFKALLSPDIKPGAKIIFASAQFNGLHRIKKMRHTGDTAGGDWYTEGEAEVTTAETKTIGQ